MANESELINITVCHSLGARQVVETTHSVPAGITVAQWLTGHDEPTPQAVLALWGRPADPAQVLREGDRLEWLRPLKVDPKVARRERFKGQGAKTAGLFASRRPGAKPGY